VPRDRDCDYRACLTKDQHLAVIDRIRNENRDNVRQHQLESEQAEAALAQQEAQYQARLAQQQAEAETLRRQIAEANARAEAAEKALTRKRSIYDDAMQQRIQQKVQERRAAAATTTPNTTPSASVSAPMAIKPAAITPTVVTPTTAVISPKQDTATEEASVPAVVPHTTLTSTPDKPRPLWRRMLGVFSARASTPQATLQQATAPTSVSASEDLTPVEPLPANRKRTTSEEESTPTKRPRVDIAQASCTARTPRALLAPSTKDWRASTSLSTVSENTEPPFSADRVPATTPSKRRTIAATRVRRQQAMGRPSNITAPPLSLKNADQRWEKMRRLQDLRKELAELNRDEDVLEMESHRRKRVKVDTLAYIPHHRPGESSSTFRVPDIDSDDEMEVDISVPERANAFEEAATLELSSEEGTVEKEEGKMEWNWPEVGRRDGEWQYNEEAAMEFEQGFLGWCSERGIAAGL
jgi:hypothetical protein